MAFYRLDTTERNKTTELVDIQGISVSATTPLGELSDGTPVHVSEAEAVSVLTEVQYPFHPNYTVDVEVLTGRFYGQFYILYLGAIELARDSLLIDLGYTKEERQYTAGIWNAYAEDAYTLTSISISQPNAVSVSGVTVGELFLQRQEKEVTLTILESVPPVINCTVVFTFSDGSFLSVVFTGIAVPFAFFKPQIQFKEFISFYTDVITSRDGSEQRRALRRYPRHTLALSYKETNQAQASKMINGLIGVDGTILGCPFWQFMRFPTVQPQSNDTVLFVATTLAIFTVDSYIVIYDQATEGYELAEIESITANTITVKTKINNNYTSAIIAPYFFMEPSTPMSWAEFPAHTAFDIEARMTVPVTVAPYEFLGTYKGVGVFPYTTNIYRSDSNQVKLLGSYDSTDNTTGVYEKNALWDSVKLSKFFGVHATTAADCYQLRRLAYALRGRQKSIWLSSFNADFLPTQDLGGNTITCEDNGYSTYIFDADTIYNHIAVHRDGQAALYAEVLSASINSSGAMLLVTDVNFDAIAKDTIKISILTRNRLNTDTIQLEWATHLVDCYCVFEFITVKE